MKKLTICFLIFVAACALCRADIRSDAQKSVVGVRIENAAGKTEDISGFLLGGCIISSDSPWLDFGSGDEMSVSFEEMKFTAAGESYPPSPVTAYNFTDGGHTVLLAASAESPLVIGALPENAETLTAAGFDPEAKKVVFTDCKTASRSDNTLRLAESLDAFYCGGPVFAGEKTVGYVYEAGEEPLVYLIDEKDISDGVKECLDNLLPRESVIDPGEDEDEDPEEEEEGAVELGGSRLVFGAYKDDPVSWDVLESKDGEALLICSSILDYGLFHKYDMAIDELKAWKAEHGAYPPVSWEESSLRKSLNEEFLVEAFSPDQRRALIPDENGDRITLLSEEEAKRFWKRYDARTCPATAFARKKGAPAKCPWWLKTPGLGDMRACAVTSDGRVDKNCMAGKNTATALAGIRPVIRVRTK
ncbi:MAG: hypothetical protein ILO36_06390 [Abditibacteriota bacterium]|nr:hypothetical protein [Abditibacteriota bacterium]